MKPPASIKVGHVRYTIAFDSDRCENAAAHGMSSGDHGTIWLRDDRPIQHQQLVLVHELLHQCLFVAGLSFEDLGIPEGDCEKVEEAVVRQMAGPLLTALRDNPGLPKFLLGPQ